MNFFLNTDKKLYPNAPEGTIAFLGNGTNIVYIDRKNDLVIVARWIENSKIDEFLGKIYASIKWFAIFNLRFAIDKNKNFCPRINAKLREKDKERKIL